MEIHRKVAHSVSKWAFIVAFVVLANIFFNVLTGVIFTEPQFNDFCPRQANFYPAGESDPYFECSEKYNEAYSKFNVNVFVVLIVIGMLVFASSFLLKNNFTLSTSLSWSAVLSFIVASFRYWGDASQLIKLVILLIALSLLVYIALKRFSDKTISN